MIVRISGEGQFRLDDSEEDRLNELEQAVQQAVSAADQAEFAARYAALLDFVRTGAPLDEDDLEPSQVILPPSDTTLAEASGEFTGEGLIPD
ncbi:MAG TPA: hypothetical protein VMA83_04700 [Solirubrobacteraceae bacterium]|nr:hypothetical protein [Solirubrobacteraceae bacterium]